MGQGPFAFLVRPHYVAKPWGGRRLESVLGRTQLPKGPVGESWEVCDTSDLRSLVDGGPCDGQPLAAALGAPFPLLIKLLDAREDLSVQVHPDGKDASPSKEEAWVALADGGSVAVGLTPGASASAPWLSRLERTQLRAADGASPPSLLHVPPGTVHAVLAGALLWEVQTPVDITWRLDDYGRPGLDGKPRELHLQQAAGVLARGPEPRGYADATGQCLVGQKLRVDLFPPGTARCGAACVAFLPDGGQVRGGRQHEPLVVPPGRSVVLTPQAVSIRSPGWIFSAAER